MARKPLAALARDGASARRQGGVRICWEDEMTRSIAWDQVTHADVLRAIREYDQLGSERFFSEHGFAPTTTHDLVWDERCGA